MPDSRRANQSEALVRADSSSAPLPSSQGTLRQPAYPGTRVRARITWTAVALGSALGILTLIASASGSTPTSSSGAVRMSALASPAPDVSSNWAGYVVTVAPPTTPAVPTASAAFTDVTGSWVQTRATCDTGETTTSAFWVGLGGSTRRAGARAARDGSRLHVGREDELLGVVRAPAGEPGEAEADDPAGRQAHRGRSLSPAADRLQPEGPDRHTRFSKRVAFVDALDLGSAEWIAEAPAACSAGGRRCRIVPLTNFGTVTFTGAAAIGSGHPGTISDPTWSTAQVALVPQSMRAPSFGGASNTHGASPSSLSPDGRSFSVAWQRTSTATTP